VVVPEIPVLEPPYRVELRAVVEAIRSGGPAPIPARDAFAGVEAVHAAITSIRTGQPVTLQGKGGNR
jgi:predicted dehydrogenase